MKRSEQWDSLTLAAHSALVSCGTFQKPLDPELENLTFGRWQLAVAKRIVAAVLAAQAEQAEGEDVTDA